uniref:hypothetical protein n=1 Tax=Candidatus Thiodubiliella endoseptemdiera TaxID=2738886 RepID=UPI0034DF50D4
MQQLFIVGYDKNYPYTDASRAVLLPSFQESIAQIKAGKASAKQSHLTKLIKDENINQ